MSDPAARMQALRLRFAERLGQEADWLADACRVVEHADNVDPHLAAELRDRAHKLSGITASLGYPSVSSAARELEELLGTRPTCDAVLTAVRQLLNAIGSDPGNSSP